MGMGILTPEVRAPSPPPVDVDRLRANRLGRLVAQLVVHDVELAVLTNPVSLRYAADWREYLPYQSHIQTYTLFVEPTGPGGAAALTLHGAYGTDHPVIQEFRPTHGLNGFDGGLDQRVRIGRFVDDVVAVVGTSARVAVEQLNPSAALALADRGLTVVDAEPLIERAKFVKSPEEVSCLRHSIAVAEVALHAMRAAVERPAGITENELFAILHHVNVANDGDWIDGRMLCSGPRTNPWYQQATDRVIEPGDLVAIDTDMVGPMGYSADISRTWLAGAADGARPTPEQCDRYRRAYDEITHNAALLAPGRTFAELTGSAFRQREEFVANRYTCLAHGVGLTDEYPRIVHRQDWDREGYDGQLQVGNVVTVESFVGSDRGGPGVKLEDMYLITDDGAERLSTFPFEPELAG
ncbi:MAG: Xaa-Pro peptidase family protein [Actinomycetota bacterium]